MPELGGSGPVTLPRFRADEGGPHGPERYQTDSGQTLDDFAAGESRPPRCAACYLREQHPTTWAEVLKGRRRVPAHPYHLIARYLRELGHKVADYQLRDHFQRHEEAR